MSPTRDRIRAARCGVERTIHKTIAPNLFSSKAISKLFYPVSSEREFSVNKIAFSYTFTVISVVIATKQDGVGNCEKIYWC